MTNHLHYSNGLFSRFSGFARECLVTLIFGVVFLGSGQRTFAQCPAPQTFTANSNITIPAGVTSVTIETWGGGGAGGGSTNAGSGVARGGAGGGGGAYSTVTLTTLSPGDILNITVGAAVAGTSGANGANGNPSFVVFNATTIASAAGGFGGTGNTTGGTPARGLGGNTGIGTVTPGANGADGASGFGIRGGAGGNGGGPGGGAGGPQTGTTGTLNGNGGSIIGGGGGGSRTSENNGSRTGGTGNRGQVRITYTIPNTVTAASSSPTVCAGSAITPITHNTTGATGIGAIVWSPSNPGGMSASFGANTINVSGTPANAGTFTYSIPMTGGCTTGQSPATGTITVNASLVGAVSANQSICTGDSPTNMTIVSATGTIQWQQADDLAFSTNVTEVGSNSTTLSGATVGALTETKYFRAVVTNGACSSITSGIITVTVSQPSAVGAVSADQTICSGNPPANMTIASPTGTIQWQRADNLAFTANVTNVGGNSATLTSAQVGNLTATRYFRAIVTSGGCTPVISDIITITVDASVAGASSADQTICSGDSPADMSIASANGPIQWQMANTPAFTAGLTDVGSGALTLTTAEVGSLTATRYFRAVVTYGACSAVNSATIEVEVNDPVVVGAVSADQTICANTAPANMTVAGAIGTIQWQRADDLAFTTNITNVGTDSPTLTGAQVGNLTADSYFRAVVTSPGCGTSVDSDIITVTVTPVSAVGAVSANQNLCSGDSPADMTIASANGTIQWQRADNLAFTTNVTDVGTNSLTLTTAEVGALTATRYFRAVVTNDVCNPINSAIITVNVSPFSAVGAISGDQTICANTSPATISIASATGTIQWQRANDLAFTAGVTNVGSGALNLTGAQAGGPLTATRYYRAVVTSGTCAPVTSAVTTVTVDPVSAVGSVSANQTICSGNQPADMSIASATGTIQWQRATNTGFTAGLTNVGTNSVILTSADAGTLTAGSTYYFRAVVKSGVCTAVNSATITVNVSATSAVGAVSANQTICSGTSPGNMTVGGTVGAIQWQRADDFAFTANVTNVGTNSTTLLGSASGGPFTSPRYFRAVVTSGVCPPVYSAIITVNIDQPAAVGAVSGDQTICSGTSPTDMSILSATGTIQWQRANNASFTSGLTNLAGANSLILTSAQTGGPFTTNRYFRAVVTNGVCTPVYSATIDVIVNPVSVVGAVSANQTVCYDTPPANNMTISTSTGTIQWQRADDATFTTNVANVGIDSRTLTPAQVGNLQVTTYFRAVVTSGVCGPATSNTITVTITPVSAVGAVSANSQTICSGTPPADMSIVSATTTIQWQRSTNNFATSTNITGANSLNLTSAQVGNLTTTTYFRARVTNGVCAPIFSETIQVTVNPRPTPSFTPNPSAPICRDGEVTYTTQASMTNYIWTIPGTEGTNYIITGGDAGTGSNTVTIQWLTAGSKTVTAHYTDANGCPSTTPASSTLIVNANKSAASILSPSVCSGNFISAVTHNTSNGTTGIDNANITGLPAGVTATWAAGQITISGTPTYPGTYPFVIPLVGCGPAANATGTFTAGNCACDFVTSTSGSFEVPAGVTQITVEAWGAGGGGGSRTSGDAGSGGGGGGGYSRSVITVTPGQTYAYVVGTGGNPAAAGGSTTFSSPTPVVANGGAGAANNATAGGAGGALGTGNVRYTGGVGASGSSEYGGGGGSSAGIAANGGAGFTEIGGNPPIGGGRGGDGGAGTSQDGYPGLVPGGGGGGANRISGTLAGGFGANGQIRITYRPTPTFDVSPPASVCQDDVVTYTTQPGAPQYDWDVPGTEGTDYEIVSGAITASSNTVTIKWLTPGDKTVTVNYSSASGCIGLIPAESYTEVSILTRSITPPSPADRTPVCIGGIFPNLSVAATGTGTLTYQWYSNTTNSTVGPDVTLLTGATSGTYTPLTSAAGTLYYFVIVEGDCGPPIATTVSGAHPVNPLTSITTQPVGAAVYCKDFASPTLLSVAATGTGTSTYQWFSNTTGLPSGGTSVGTGDTYLPSTATVGSRYYYAVATSDCGSVTSDVVEIEVTPLTTITTQPLDNVYCQDAAATPLSVTVSGTGTFTYEWFSNTTGLPSGGDLVGTDPTYSPSTSVVGSTTYYYVVVTSSACGSATSNVAEIQVYPEMTIDTQPSTSSQTQCIGVAFSPISVAVTGTGTPTYQWYSNSSPSNSGGTLMGGPQSAILTPPSNVAGGLYYYVEVTDQCSTVTSDVSGLFTVNPNTSIDDEELAGQTICDGGSFSPISVTASGTGTLSYQWYSNTSASTSGATPVGTDSDSYTPLQTDFASISETRYYYVVVSQTGGCGPPVTSGFSGAFVINELTQITTHPDPSLAGDVECAGDGFDPISVVAEGVGLSYQWYSNSSQTNSGGTAISGATNDDFTPPSDSEGSNYYYVVVTGICGVVTSNVTGEFIVTPSGTAITIDLDPLVATGTICFGESFTPVEVEAIGEGTVSYRWYRNSNPSNTGGTLIAGQTNSNFTPPTTVGTFYYYAMASSDCGTVRTAVSGAYTVDPLTEIQSEDMDGQIICEGESFDPISIEVIGRSPFTYQWYSNTTNSNNIGDPDVEPVGTNSDTFIPTVNPGETLYYFVVVSSVCGPDDTSNPSGAFTVNPETTIGTDPSPAVPAPVCVGESYPTLSVDASGTGILTYQWYSNTTNSNNIGDPGVVELVGETDATFTPIPTSEDPLYYFVVVSGGCGLPVASDVSGLHAVNPSTLITVEPVAASYCQDEPVVAALTVTATGNGTISYEWFSNTSNSTVGGTSVGIGQTYTPSTAAIATTYYYAVATSDCGTSTSDVVAIVITPANEIVTQPVGATYCEDDVATALSVAASGTGITYEWFSNTTNTTTGGTSVGVGSTYTPSTANGGNTFYYAVASGATCGPVTSDVVEIIVTAVNTVSTASSSPELCVDTPMPDITHTTTGADGIVPEGPGVFYNLPPGVTAGWNAGTGIITISGTPTLNGIYNYSIPLSGGCGEVFATGTISVETPDYGINFISVTNPPETQPQTPDNSTFTVNIPNLAVGTYTITYTMTGPNGLPLEQTLNITVTTPGSFSFDSHNYVNPGSSTMTITSIREAGDQCPYIPTVNNTAIYGISCSGEYLRSAGNSVFYVPAGVTEVTIQVTGTGGTRTETISVLPGGIIYVGFGNNRVFATEEPPSVPTATRIANAIVAVINTSSTAGKVNFLFRCTPYPPCVTRIYDGTNSGGSNEFTVLQLIGDCDWVAPEGLDEFEALIVGAGGGGGHGTAAGGGGGGGVVYHHYTGITTAGVPGLATGTIFEVNTGTGGSGSSSNVIRGGNGGSTTFETGTAFLATIDGIGGSFLDITVLGGGGGASSASSWMNALNGPNIANGGGAGAYTTGNLLFGNQYPGVGGNPPTGNRGGNGSAVNYAPISRPIAGGGGAGAGGNGIDAIYTYENDWNVSGNGGNGLVYDISGTSIAYGAGGGGTSGNSIYRNVVGLGGSSQAGGNGNNDGPGFSGSEGAFGAGGGAGQTGGGNGASGVVYIRYPNYRILPVEYLYFNAKYNPGFRSGDLTWGTAKEWENDRFEIERSVNTVKDWETIGQVQGAGYSDQPVNYVYQDMKLPLSGGNIFYRLKQRSFNGDSTYSDTKSIRVEALPGTSYWRVYPNPTTGNPINLELLDNGIYHDELVTVRIIAATGQYDVVESKEGTSLNALVSESLRNKAAGVYTIEINWGLYREYHKVILKR